MLLVLETVRSPELHTTTETRRQTRPGPQQSPAPTSVALQLLRAKSDGGQIGAGLSLVALDIAGNSTAAQGTGTATCSVAPHGVRRCRCDSGSRHDIAVRPGTAVRRRASSGLSPPAPVIESAAPRGDTVRGGLSLVVPPIREVPMRLAGLHVLGCKVREVLV